MANTKPSGMRNGGSNTATGPRAGATIMKTVSVLLASARRSSIVLQQRKAAEEALQSEANVQKKYQRRRTMEERAANMPPKLLESLAKRTHFTKYAL